METRGWGPGRAACGQGALGENDPGDEARLGAGSEGEPGS